MKINLISFLTGGFSKMVFKLFSNVKYYELAPEIVSVKEKNFDTADVWLDIENKKVILYTNNGELNVVFNDYNELLEDITRISKAVYVNDMIEALNNAINDLTVNRRDRRLEVDTGVVDRLINEIEKTKESLFEGVYKVMIKVGYLNKEEVDKLVESNTEIKKSVKDGVVLYRELCWETYEDSDPDYCDRVMPVIDAVVYAVPESKEIITVIRIDTVGDVYRVVKAYENAYDFLKGLEEYSTKVMDP